MKKSTAKQIADAHRKSMELFITFDQWAKGCLNPNFDQSNYEKAFEQVKREQNGEKAT